MRNHLKLATSAAMLAVMWQTGAQASPVLTLDFSSPVILAANETPGTWYPNSFSEVPDSFSVVGGKLEEVISPSTSIQYQGRAYLMPDGVVEVRASLFIDPSWATTGRQMASLWGIIISSNSLSVYVPIIEFTSDGAGPRFQGWNSIDGFWYNLGIPIGFVYGEHEIGFRITGSNSLEYLLDGVGIGTIAIGTSGSIGIIALEGVSYPDQPGSYTIVWDDIIASDASPDGGGGNGGVADVPEPGAMTLLGAGILGLGLMHRHRKAVRLS